MTRYENEAGDVIETHGSIYVLNGIATDIIKWSDSAESWIDRDIANGLRSSFRKVGE